MQVSLPDRRSTQLNSWPVLTRQNQNIDPIDNEIKKQCIVIPSTSFCKYFIWLKFCESFACVFEVIVLISSGSFF